MTPQEQFEREVWWMLREIHKESFAAPLGKPLEFDLRIQLGKEKLPPDDERPVEDAQRKILYKLRELQAIDVQKRWNILDEIGPRYGQPPPTEFDIKVLQPKFDEVYQSFENKFGYEKPKKEKEPISLKVISMPELVIQNSKGESAAITKSKVELQSETITFDDNQASIYIGKNKCSLPPFKNGHFFCRAMFKYDVNEPVDWTVAYEEMTGFYEKYYGKPANKKENWRAVYDAMEGVNKKVKAGANTDDDLFSWQEKTVRRNY